MLQLIVFLDNNDRQNAILEEQLLQTRYNFQDPISLTNHVVSQSTNIDQIV